MPNFDITLNIYVFLLSLGLSLVLGFWGRSNQLAKKHRRIVQLEQEVTEANAETLESQKDYHELEMKYKDLTNPVITMKSNKLEDSPIADRDGMRQNRATGTD
jgi:uncharacterized membrane protein